MDRAVSQTTSSPASTRIVDVLVPVALNQAYSYRVPRGMELRAGDVVGVPLGPREVLAVVWAENANPDPRLHNRLKDVGEKLDVPPLKDELRSLVDWVANYTLSSRGMVLRMCLRMGEHLGPERVRMGVRLIGEPPKRLTPARRRLIELLADGLLHGKSEAAKEAGVSVGVIDSLVTTCPLRSLMTVPLGIWISRPGILGVVRVTSWLAGELIVTAWDSSSGVR